MKKCEHCGLERYLSAKGCKVCKYKDGKKCSGCQEFLSIDNFAWRNGKYPKYRSQCKDCENKKGREYRKSIDPKYLNERGKKWRTEINPKAYKKMLIRQAIKKMNIECEIEILVDKVYDADTCESCGNKFLVQRDKHIDHCHTTNNYRGILCRSCNHALGHCKDDISVLENLINYLKTKNNKD
jgi:hypothetical protein